MIKQKIKTAISALRSGHNKIEKPLSLLIFLWIAALLIMGAVNKFFGEREESYSIFTNNLPIEESIKNFKEETEEEVKTNEYE